MEDFWEIDLWSSRVLFGLPPWLSSKESPCNAGDVGSIPGSGRLTEGGSSKSPQYSCLGNPNPMDTGKLVGYSSWGHIESDKTEYACQYSFFVVVISFLLLLFFYYSGFCHTLKWNSHGFTCVPHPDPPSHLPLRPIPLELPGTPGPSACLRHLT